MTRQTGIRCECLQLHATMVPEMVSRTGWCHPLHAVEWVAHSMRNDSGSFSSSECFESSRLGPTPRPLHRIPRPHTRPLPAAPLWAGRTTRPFRPPRVVASLPWSTPLQRHHQSACFLTFRLGPDTLCIHEPICVSRGSSFVKIPVNARHFPT